MESRSPPPLNPLERSPLSRSSAPPCPTALSSSSTTSRRPQARPFALSSNATRSWGCLTSVRCPPPSPPHVLPPLFSLSLPFSFPPPSSSARSPRVRSPSFLASLTIAYLSTPQSTLSYAQPRLPPTHAFFSPLFTPSRPPDDPTSPFPRATIRALLPLPTAIRCLTPCHQCSLLNRTTQSPNSIISPLPSTSPSPPLPSPPLPVSFQQIRLATSLLTAHISVSYVNRFNNDSPSLPSPPYLLSLLRQSV